MCGHARVRHKREDIVPGVALPMDPIGPCTRCDCSCYRPGATPPGCSECGEPGPFVHRVGCKLAKSGDTTVSIDIYGNAHALTLPDAVLSEMKRVRDDVLALYIACAAKAEPEPPPSRYHPDLMKHEPIIEARSFTPGIALMRADLDAAARALAYQDAPELVHLLARLKGWQP